MTIEERQNEEDMLNLLKAKSAFYNKAKNIKYIKIYGSIFLYILFMILTLCLKNNIINNMSIAISFILLFVNLFFDKSIKKNKELGAGMQQWFDLYVLDLKETDSHYRLNSKPNRESMLVYRNKYKNKKYKNIKDWYVVSKNLSSNEKIMQCQKTNYNWEISLRKIYLYIDIIICLILIVSTILISILQDNGQNFFVILFWIMPVLQLCCNSTKNLKLDIERLNTIKNELIICENMKNEKDLFNALCDVQYLIFEHRQKNYIIPNWLYKITRNNYQNNQKAIVEGIDKNIKK